MGPRPGALVLPPETSGSRRSAGLDHRNSDARSYEAGRLGKPNGLNGVAVDGLYEAIADGVEGGAECPDIFKRGFVQGLLDGRRDRPQLDQRRPAWRVDKGAVDQMPGPKFPDL